MNPRRNHTQILAEEVYENNKIQRAVNRLQGLRKYIVYVLYSDGTTEPLSTLTATCEEEAIYNHAVAGGF